MRIGQKRKSKARDRAGERPAQVSCPICGAHNLRGGHTCGTCRTDFEQFTSDARSARRALIDDPPRRVQGRVVALAAQVAGSPLPVAAKGGWAASFEISMDDGTVAAVCHSEVTHWLYDPLSPEPGTLRLDTEVEILGEVQDIFAEHHEGLRDAPAHTLQVRAHAVMVGSSGSNILSRLEEHQGHDSVFNLLVRAAECDHCLKTVRAPLSGGEITCRNCKKTVRVAPRIMEHRWRGGAADTDPTERQAVLKQQARSHDSLKTRLQPNTNEDLIEIARRFNEVTDMSRPLSGLRGSWAASRSVFIKEPSADHARRMFYFGCILAEAHCRAGDHRWARSVLEQLLDLLPDEEQRDIVRCRLARAAILADDEVAAVVWLSRVDPLSHNIYVHTEVTTTRALYALHQGDLEAALQIVGDSKGDRTLAPDPLVDCLRAHALAGLGRQAQARSVINGAVKHFDPLRVSWIWRVYTGPSTSLVPERVWQGKTSIASFIPHAVLFFLVGVLPFNCVFLPTCQLALNRHVMEETLQILNRCPEVTDRTGKNVTWAVGCNRDDGGCEGWGTMRLAIKGDVRRGFVTLDYEAHDNGKGARYSVMLVKVDGVIIDALNCRISSWSRTRSPER